MKTVLIKADEYPAVRKEMQKLFSVEKLESEKSENAGAVIKFDRKYRKVTRNVEAIDTFGVIPVFQ